MDEFDFSVRWKQIKMHFQQAVLGIFQNKLEHKSIDDNKKKKVFGREGFGNMLFEARKISTNIVITFITTLSSMDW